jgi:hypothetical protein
MVAASSEKNFEMEEPARMTKTLGLVSPIVESELLVLDCLRRSTGLLILGLLPSNDLIQLQFEFSTGVRVPTLVPDRA